MLFHNSIFQSSYAQWPTHCAQIMSHYACETSPSRGAWHRFPFDAPDVFSCNFCCRLTFGAHRISKNVMIGLWAPLEWGESLSGSALLRDTEHRELELDSAITCGYCSTAHSTCVKCSEYAVLCSVFYALCSVMLLFCSRIWYYAHEYHIMPA